MDIDKRKLVAAVHQYPCLWKTTDRDYKDLKAREEAWKEVASQVCDVEAVDRCMVKWKSLRDRFVRELKKLRQQQASVPDGCHTSSWVLFSELLFLRHSIKHRIVTYYTCTKQSRRELMSKGA